MHAAADDPWPRDTSRGRAHQADGCAGVLLETDISLVEHCPTGSVVASGNLATADEDPAVAEIGVLVEDGWQGLGLCAALLRQLVAGARMAGFGEVAVRLGLAPHHRGMLGRAATQTPRTLVSRSGLA